MASSEKRHNIDHAFFLLLSFFPFPCVYIIYPPSFHSLVAMKQAQELASLVSQHSNEPFLNPATVKHITTTVAELHRVAKKCHPDCVPTNGLLLELALLDYGAKSLQDSDTKKQLAKAGGKVVVGIFKTVMKGGLPDAAIWTGLRDAAVALREGADHAVASAVFMTGMYARYATLDLTREVAQLTRDVGKKGNSIKRDALVQIRNRLGAAYQMSVGRSKNARQVVLLWIELLGLLVCGDAMASTSNNEKTEDIAAGGVPCPEILILLWEGFDGMVDDMESPEITVIRDQLEHKGDAAVADTTRAVAETKRAAHDAAISAHQEMEKAAKREVGKAFHGLKHFLEYGVKDAASAASGTIAFPLSLVSIGTDLVTNPGGLLERMANVANWLFQETTLRLEREIVEFLEAQSQQLVKLAKKQYEKDIQEIAQDVERSQEQVVGGITQLENGMMEMENGVQGVQEQVSRQVAETKQAINDTVQQGKEHVLQQAHEIEGQVVTKTNAALQEAHASAQRAIAAALLSANRKIESAQGWLEISETQIKSMKSTVTRINTFAVACFEPMHKHVTTLESMSEKVAHALHGAVALAHSSIGQAQQDATQKITDFARERLKEITIILDKAIEQTIDHLRDAAVHKLAGETPQIAAQATKTAIGARNATLAVAAYAKSAAQCAVLTLDELVFVLSKIEHMMELLSDANKLGNAVKEGLTKAATTAAAAAATKAKDGKAEDGIIPFPISLVSIGLELVTNPAGLLEQFANAAKSLLSDTTKRLEEAVVARFELESQQAAQKIQSHCTKFARVLREQVATVQQISATGQREVRDAMDTTVLQVHASEQKVVEEANDAIQSAHQDVKQAVLSGVESTNETIMCAEE